MSSRIKSFFRRISKDHGGSKSSQDPEGQEDRKLSSTAGPLLLPSKRAHGGDAESSTFTSHLFPPSDDRLQHPGCDGNSDGKSSGGGKQMKYKKLAVTTNNNRKPSITPDIPETDETMDVETQDAKCTIKSVSAAPPSVAKESSTPLKSAPPSAAGQTIIVSKGSSNKPIASEDGVRVTSSQESTTITINSIVPEVAASAVDVSSKVSVVSDPSSRRVVSANDVTDSSSRKQTYSVKQAAGLSTPEPVKSVSITKLENIDLPSDSTGVSSCTKVTTNSNSSSNSSAAMQRKLSSPQSKNCHAASSDFAPSITLTGSDSTNSTSCSKKSKTDDVSADRKFQTARAERLEKMVSDLVKNAEVKKQEIAALRMEIKRLKEAAREQQSDEERKASTAAAASSDAQALNNERMDDLLEENRALRGQLLHLGGSLNSSRLSDHEKEALLKGGSWGERSTTGATVGDWDAKSSSSEVSVACLQDRIMQMEETHYCTNEELQATLQELDDLRDQLTDSQARLHQVTEDKQVVVDTLNEQTKSLEVARFQNTTFKQLLIQHSENSQSMSSCVSSQKLLELLKTVEEDHERLLQQQDHLKTKIASVEEAENKYNQESQVYSDRLESLEASVSAVKSQRDAAVSQAADLQETLTVQRLEAARLQAALTAAKEKVSELEARVLSGGAADEMVASMREEKERLEHQVTDLTHQNTAATAENARVREQLHNSHEKLKKAESRALAGVQDASERSQRLEEERRALLQQATDAEMALSDSRQTVQRHLQSKRELKTALADTEKRLTQAINAKQHTEQTMATQKKKFEEQVEEWDQFQRDLLTTVRVANDFKMEAHTQMEKINAENALLIRQINAYEKKYPASKVSLTTSSSITSSSTIGHKTSVAERLSSDTSKSTPAANPDRPLVRTDSRVKSLIESLEGGGGVSTAGSKARVSPPDSGENTPSATTPTRKVTLPLLKRTDTENVIRPGVGLLSSPLKESGNIDPAPSSSRSLRSSYSESLSSKGPVTPPPPSSPTANLPDTDKISQLGEKANNNNNSKLITDAKQSFSILLNKGDNKKTNNYSQMKNDKKDPLAILAQGGGSKRNALLKWCQSRTIGYTQVDITNFSSSWNDGLAFCAILDTYIPEKINYRTLNHGDKRANFETSLAAAESVGIHSTLDVSEMMNSERPNWQTVYNYVTSIYAHFET